MQYKNYQYDIALSFAGEDRDYVEEVSKCLKTNDVQVFYDSFEEEELWGKDLYVHLDNVYRNQARFCIMFLSENYSNKLWTNHERKSAQARAFQQNEEYILPVKLDDTEIPGIRPTTGYLNGKKKTPNEICEAAIKKLGKKTSNKEYILEEKPYIPKVKRTISDLEKNKFLKSAFNEIKNYFQKGLQELKSSNAHIDIDIDENSTTKFFASVYVEGNLKSKCKIWIGGLLGNDNSISYAEGVRGWDDNSLNDSATVKNYGYEIFFDILGMVSGHLEGINRIDLKHASKTDLAMYYWARFINYLRF